MLIVLSRSRCFFPLANYTRTADQNVTSPTDTQHSAQRRATINSSAQAALDTINLLVAPNHGPLLSAPFAYMPKLHSSLRERSGRRQPPAEQSTCVYLTHVIDIIRVVLGRYEGYRNAPTLPHLRFTGAPCGLPPGAPLPREFFKHGPMVEAGA